MPTAEEFYAAKGDAEEQLSVLAQFASDVESVYGETGFVGASLQNTLNDGISKAAELKRRAVEAGDQLIAELQRRAEVCEQHRAAVEAWEYQRNSATDDAALDALGPRPQAPYPWVEPQ